jgi:hypothetical protein
MIDGLLRTESVSSVNNRIRGEESFVCSHMLSYDPRKGSCYPVNLRGKAVDQGRKKEDDEPLLCSECSPDVDVREVTMCQRWPPTGMG